MPGWVGSAGAAAWKPDMRCTEAAAASALHDVSCMISEYQHYHVSNIIYYNCLLYLLQYWYKYIVIYTVYIYIYVFFPILTMFLLHFWECKKASV